MVKTHKPDYFKIPAMLISLAVIVYIGYSLYDQSLWRQDLSHRINKAVQYNDKGQLRWARNLLLQAQAEWHDRRKKPAEVILGKIREFDPDIESRLAVVHRNLGFEYQQAQYSEMAVRNFALALAYDPECRDIPEQLSLECFFTKNYELGWISTKKAAQQAGGAAAKSRLRYFEKHYKGPKYEL